MNAKDLEKKATALVEQALAGGGPPEPRIVHCEDEQAWSPLLLRTVSDHRLHVLGRDADIVVFFDNHGREIGWRDDGRRGEPQPILPGKEAFRLAVMAELDLPRNTRLAALASRELPPVGWTTAGVFLLKPVPQPEDTLRVWTNPKSLRVIQCLLGPVAGGRGSA